MSTTWDTPEPPAPGVSITVWRNESDFETWSNIERWTIHPTGALVVVHHGGTTSVIAHGYWQEAIESPSPQGTHEENLSS